MAVPEYSPVDQCSLCGAIVADTAGHDVLHGVVPPDPDPPPDPEPPPPPVYVPDLETADRLVRERLAATLPKARAQQFYEPAYREVTTRMVTMTFSTFSEFDLWVSQTVDVVSGVAA